MNIGWPDLFDGRCEECGRAINVYPWFTGGFVIETVAVDGKVYCGKECREMAERKGQGWLI